MEALNKPPVGHPHHKTECLHEEIYFGSGDYYIFCANPECGRRWRVDGDVSNKGDQCMLSGERRVKSEW